MASLFSHRYSPWLWTALAAGFIYLVKGIRYYMQGGQFRKNTTAAGKIVIVTGSNTGIGKETVRELAKRGATIYMACRNMKKCEEARQEIIAETHNQRIYSRELDLSSLESVRKFAENFKREEQSLDILINNAGVMMCPLSRTQDGFEMQIGVNHMGHFLLTNLLLDLLKKPVTSRIVVVSSIAHEASAKINQTDLNSEESYDSMAAYKQSKLANILFTRELAQRLKGTGVTVNALHPGVVETELFRYIFENPLIRYIMQPLCWPFMKSIKSGAQTTLYAALDPDLEHISGKYFSDCKLKAMAPAALDDDMAKWLWRESEKWTKIYA